MIIDANAPKQHVCQFLSCWFHKETNQTFQVVNEHTATALELVAEGVVSSKQIHCGICALRCFGTAARYGFFRNSNFDAEKPSIVAFCQMGLRLGYYFPRI